MSVSTIIALLRFLVWAVQLVKESYDSLTPDEKAEIARDYQDWQKAIKNVQDPVAGKMDGP
jgi:hypothetical protein